MSEAMRGVERDAMTRPVDPWIVLLEPGDA
jgi:hypothetical protein